MLGASHKSKVVLSLPEFMEETFLLISEFETYHAAEIPIWFRGEASIKYNLIPSLFRDDMLHSLHDNKLTNISQIKNIEENIDINFSRLASSYFSNSGINSTHWNRYYLKQHYGIKTRLLDWTENVLLALFFALNDSNQENSNIDARVWFLSPFSLNDFALKTIKKTSFKSKVIFSPYETIPKRKKSLNDNKGLIRSSELLRQYLRLDMDSSFNYYPLAIYPPHLDPRMASQQACFTLFGNMVTLPNNTDFLKSIHIKASEKIKMLSDLYKIGISMYSIFPDLEGLGKSINYQVKKELKFIKTDSIFSFDI